MSEVIPEERLTCKYCSYCMCSESDNGGAYCCADIHDYIPDINSGNICCDFDYDDIKCPNCGEEIFLDSDLLDLDDDTISCPNCGHEIELECDCFDDDFEDEE